MSNKATFRKLFEPAEIGTLRLKNRIVMPTVSTSFATITGEATPTHVDWYTARTKGGAGLIFVDMAHVAVAIDPMRQLTRHLRLDDDSFEPALAEVAEAMHEAGGKAGIQLTPGVSSQARLGLWTIGQAHIVDVPPVGPSTVPHPETKRKPRELTTAEVEKIVELFGYAAARAKEVGFDIIEINSHSGFLLGQFLSPYFNRRTDKYGGSPERRFTFLAEILESIRKQVGSRFPVVVKYSIDEFIDGGRDMKEGQAIARRLEKAGVDAITVSAGIHGARLPSMPSMYHAEGTFIFLAEAVKEVVSLPVILPGRLSDPHLAEKVLEEGKADFIAWGRPLVADPDMPRKVAEGRLEDIRRCISCNECVRIQWAHKSPLRCTVNPVAGREGRYGVIRRADAKKKVIIIGAGPAGMEAARVAALRGHDVTLYERTAELGGCQLKIAATPPHKDVLKYIVDYYTAAFKKLDNVKLVLGKEVTAREIIQAGADVVIVATGAVALVPDMPGVNGDNVVTAHQLLSGKRTAGETVVVAGGGSVGCEVADWLASQGKKVTVVEMLDAVATDVHAMVRIGLLGDLSRQGVTIMTGTKVDAITGEGVQAIDNNGHKHVLKADTVVLALGAKAEDGLAGKLSGKVRELYTIGDARQPRRIRNAISEGFVTAFGI